MNHHVCFVSLPSPWYRRRPRAQARTEGSLIVAGPHRAFNRRTTGDESFGNSYSLLRSEESPIKTAPIAPGPNLSDSGRKIPGPTSTALCMTSKWWQMRRRNLFSHHTRQSSSHPPSRLLFDYLDHYHVFCRSNCHHDPYELPRLVLYCIHMYPTPCNPD